MNSPTTTWEPARAVNDRIASVAPALAAQLSSLASRLYLPDEFPAQAAEAARFSHRWNASAGVARADGRLAVLPVLAELLGSLPAEEVLDYTPAGGLPELRTCWQAKLRRENPSLGDLPLTLPVVTAGVTHAISLALDLFLDAGDAVVLPDLHWPNYGFIAGAVHGAVTRTFPFYAAGAFNLAGLVGEVKRARAEGRRVVVLLNFPSNPTGYSLCRGEQEQVAAALFSLADQAPLVVLCDDAYAGLYHDPACAPESLFGVLAGQHHKLTAVKADGATKEFMAWGLRVGFLTLSAAAHEPDTAHRACEEKLVGALRGQVSSLSTPGQHLVLRALEDDRLACEVRRHREEMAGRYVETRRALDGRPGRWDVHPFNSGYFVCLRLRHGSAESLRRALLREYQVGSMRVGECELRLAYSCLDKKDIPTVVDKIFDAAHNLV